MASKRDDRIEKIKRKISTLQAAARTLRIRNYYLVSR